jgi:hypothetical protein
MSHTKGKLEVDKTIDHTVSPHRVCYLIFTEDPLVFIATTFKDSETDRAKAERLCLCWNTHDDLLEALKELVNYIEANDWESEFADPLPTAKAAIAKAESKDEAIGTAEKKE